MNQRFTTAFNIAYDSLVGPRGLAASADAAACPGGNGDESAGSNAAESAGSQEIQAEKKDTRGTELSAFRKQCEQHCHRELEARLVLLVAHAELRAVVTNTRLYHNLTESVSCYDVKNARLCNICQGEGVILFTECPTS